MAADKLLEGPRPRHRLRGPSATSLVVFLHGLGADGADLISLADPLSKVLPEAEFVAPDAPFPCDMAPMGRQWFSLQRSGPEDLLTGAQAAAPHLNAFLDAELERLGLAANRLALVGFSQGTMMSLFCALRRPQAVAGIVGFSGLLIAPERLPAEIVSRPPVLLGARHGRPHRALRRHGRCRSRTGGGRHRGGQPWPAGFAAWHRPGRPAAGCRGLDGVACLHLEPAESPEAAVSRRYNTPDLVCRPSFLYQAIERSADSGSFEGLPTATTGQGDSSLWRPEERPTRPWY